MMLVMSKETIYFKSETTESMSPAKPGDVGHDLKAVSMKIVGEKYGTAYYKRIDYIEYDTGIAVGPESSDVWTLLFSNSRVSKTNLVQANCVGVIDNGYRGNLLIRFKYIFQPEDLNIFNCCDIVGKINTSKIFNVGDTIGQLVVAKAVPTEFIKADSLTSTERGTGGFGSTENKA